MTYISSILVDINDLIPVECADVSEPEAVVVFYNGSSVTWSSRIFYV